MRINRDSLGWVLVSAVILACATGCYAVYAMRAPHGPGGGSAWGLIFAGVGSAMMIFALLLGPRKFFRTKRVGKARLWLQGHIWFGLISYPIILFHAGMRWGGPLTSVLMWLFTAVVVTGLIGLMLQQLV